MTNYIITQTEIHHVSADSVKEAQDLFNENTFDLATSITVEIVEADFKNEVPQLLPRVLQIEAPKWDGYPSKDEEVTVTFGTLKTVQNEEILKGIRYAMDYLEDINYHDGANALEEFIDYIQGTMSAPEWQSEFFARHPLYTVPTE